MAPNAIPFPKTNKCYRLHLLKLKGIFLDFLTVTVETITVYVQTPFAVVSQLTFL